MKTHFLLEFLIDGKDTLNIIELVATFRIIIIKSKNYFVNGGR